jgi:hypothetical protein
MAEPSLREQLRMRLESGMTRNPAPSNVGPGDARSVRFAPARVEELDLPSKAEDAGGAAESEELLAEKRRVLREALGGEEAPRSETGSTGMSSSEFARMRRSTASPVATPGQGSRAPPVAGSSAIGSSARAQTSEGHQASVPEPQQAVVARLQLASPAQEAEVAKWRASVMEKKTFSGPHAVASLEAAKRTKEALALYDLIPPSYIRLGAVGSSRVPSSHLEQMKERVDALAEAGGKASDATKKARLFLTEWMAFLASKEVEQAADPFPIYTGDIRRFKQWAPSKTARERAVDAANFLSEVVTPGLVVLDEIGTKNMRVRLPTKGLDRAPFGPGYLCDLDTFVNQAPDEVPGGEVAHWYGCLQACELKFGARFGSMYGSEFVQVQLQGDHSQEAAAGVAHLRTAEGTTDKVDRALVDLYTDVSGLVEVEAEWMRPFMAKCMGAGITCPAWTQLDMRGPKPSRPGRYVDLVANAGFQMDGEDLVLADKAVASEAMTQITSIVSGIPREQLQAAKLTGTHPARKVGGSVTWLLYWPKPEADLVGDWAQDTRPGGPVARSAARKKRASVREKHYVPNFTMAEQMAVRRRFWDAVRTGIAVFGRSNVKWETEWSEIFPDPTEGPVPAELAGFYGPGARYKAEYEPFVVRTAETVEDGSPAAVAKRRRTA